MREYFNLVWFKNHLSTILFSQGTPYDELFNIISITLYLIKNIKISDEFLIFFGEKSIFSFQIYRLGRSITETIKIAIIFKIT